MTDLAVAAAAADIATGSIQDRVVPRLLSAGLLQESHVLAAQAARSRERSVYGLVYHLADLRCLPPCTLAAALEDEFGMAAITLEPDAAEPDALELVSPADARAMQVLPLRKTAAALQVAVLNPYDLDAIHRLRKLTGLEVDALLADEYSLRRSMAAAYTSRRSLEQRVGRAAEHLLDPEPGGAAAPAFEASVHDAEVPRLVEEVLADAVDRGASDVHFEFYEEFGRIRYRIDGHLVEMTRAIPPRIGPHIVNRIKVVSGMNSAQDRIPDDGTTSYVVNGRRMDFRVSTLPTAAGVEKVVLRVLERDETFRPIEGLGIEPTDLDLLLGAARRTRGMILVTGPTGSGKSTTLYSMLDHLNRTHRNIVTVEDPVERKIAGIQQVQVRPHEDRRLDLSYPVVLRAVLRQDPDVIMVGEIRDTLTAQIALRAAMTGHLVLATLHTNDTVSTVTRLVDMGVERFHITGSVTLLIAQRLMRRICGRCREPHVPTAEELLDAGVERAELAGAELWRGSGCEHCAQTGYRDRVGIYEVLVLTRGIRTAIAAGAGEDEIRDLAVAQGTIPLRAAALRRVRDGVTTVAELAALSC